MNITLIIKNTPTHPHVRISMIFEKLWIPLICLSRFFGLVCATPPTFKKRCYVPDTPPFVAKPLELSHSNTEFAFDVFEISWSLLLKLTIILLLPLANCLYDTDIYTYSQWVTCKWETVYTHRHLTLSIILIMKKTYNILGIFNTFSVILR